MFTTDRSVVLTLLPGDSFPVVITGAGEAESEKTNFLLLLNCGIWESDGDVIKMGIQHICRAFSTDPRRMSVVVGPGIRSCCYKSVVTDELEIKRDWSTYVRDGHIDLPGFITNQLEEEGILPDHIYDTGLCTWCAKTESGEHLFFSDLRSDRTGDRNGRFATVAMLTP
jgi:copper oxidase (laccase) domain-containing protein